MVRAARWCRRNRTVAGLSLALIVSLGALVFVQSARLRASRIDAARIEVERLRAEEHLRFSSQAFGNLSWMTKGLFGNLEPWQVWSYTQTSQQLQPLLEDLQLRRDRGELDDAGLLSLGILATTLGEHLRGTVPPEEGSELFEVARSSLRACAETYPEVEICTIALIRALLASIHFTIQWPGQEFSDAVAYLDEAETLLASLAEQGHDTPELCHQVASRKLLLARVFRDRGNLSAARSLLRAVEEDLRRSPGSIADQLEVRVELANVLDLFGDREAGLAEMRSVLSRCDLADPRFDRAVADWIARPGGPLLMSIESLLGPESLSAPEAPGGPLFRILCDDLALLGLPANPTPSFLSKGFYLCYLRINGCLVRLRQADRIERARRGTSEMLQLAEHLITLAPDEPGLYWILSETMLQLAKNGWRAEGGPDYAEIRRWTTRSREALERASQLDPATAFFPAMIHDRDRRLFELPED